MHQADWTEYRDCLVKKWELFPVIADSLPGCTVGLHCLMLRVNNPLEAGQTAPIGCTYARNRVSSTTL